MPQKNIKSRLDNLTNHEKVRLEQRKITSKEIDQAKETAKKSGEVEMKVGKYGTIQRHYHGKNGVTVIEETSGRNAGKVITSWRR